MSDITPINPSAGLPEDGNEDPFESMLDAESDEDFGYVVTKDRATGPDGHPVKLADWSAQDFASIYTRFRPHLERHARRFLNNPSQVDEVVQDAFLYLMVSLPELDSEIGVLRFLKWKTRLLCLDVIRASGKAYVANIDDVAEPMSSDPEVSSYLEQQDDAAVLRLALSKLNPRHREVLLASIYEEKSTQEIATQVGLSENATRQLIFRARSAFKKALLGEDVNTEGMSAAAILSVAARKAAQEAKKVGAQAMVFALFLMLAIGAFVNFTGRGTQTQQLAESQAPTPETTSFALQTPSFSNGATPNPTPPGVNNLQPDGTTGSLFPQKSQPDSQVEPATPSPTINSSEKPMQHVPETLFLNEGPVDAKVYKVARTSLDPNSQDFVMVSQAGMMVEIGLDLATNQPTSNIRITFTGFSSQNTLEGQLVSSKIIVGDITRQTYFFKILDPTGLTGQEEPIGLYKVEMGFDSLTGAIVQPELHLLPTSSAMYLD